MATSIEELEAWMNSRSEHQQLEFKEAKSQYDTEKLCRYCVGMANEGGGKFLLGITDKPPRRVVGSQAINNVVGMAEKIYRELNFRVDIEEVQHPDGRIVIIHIPSRPLGTAYSRNGAYLMRSGEQLVPMSEDRLRTIFAEGQPHWLDQNSYQGVTTAKIIELLDVSTYFQLIQRPYPTSETTILEQLLSQRLLTVDANGWSIPRCTAVLLARDLSTFPELSRKAARVIVYHANSKSAVTFDRTWTTGYAVGFQSLIEFIMQQIQREVYEKGLRKLGHLVPEIAIRETVANAMVHQDFTMTGTSLMIELYPTRVEVSSPGEPIVPVERFIDGSQSRNEHLTELMRQMFICEERSSGIDKVVEAAEKNHLIAPAFMKEFQRTSIVMHGKQNFASMNRGDRLRACYQHCVLMYVRKEYMTNLSLRQRFDLPSQRKVTVSQLISAAVSGGLIKLDAQVGDSKRLARYLPHWA